MKTPPTKYTKLAPPKRTAVDPLLACSSSLIAVKKAPKLYATPNTVNSDNVAPATVRHARAESMAATGATAPPTCTARVDTAASP